MHPILIQVNDDFFIGTYGLMIALALFASAFLSSWLAKKRGMPADAFYDLTFIAIVAGFLGGRVLFILTNFPDFLQDPIPYLLSRTGFVFLGGLIGAAAACMYYVKRKGLDLWNVADVAAPAVAIGHGLGRIGCHFAGCCYGGVCHAPVGLEVPRVAMGDGDIWTGSAYYDHLAQGLIAEDAAHSLPVWPVQLMESGALFLLCATLVWLYFRGLARGRVFAVYLMAYAVIRFGLEFLRGDAVRGLYFGDTLSTSQLLSIAIFAAGMLVWWVVKDASPPRTGEDEARRRRRPTTGSGNSSEPAQSS